MTDITKSLNDATTHDEINAILNAVRDGAVSTERQEPRTKATEDVAEPTFTRTENINGRELTFTAGSEVELERMIGDAYKVAFAVQPSPSASVEEPAPTIDPAKAAMEQAELEMRFRNGSISAKEYLERSGAVADYLEKQGVPVEELQQTIQEKRETKFVHSWASATEEFLHSPAGADWPGGDRNRQLIGMQIAALGLVDAEDKVAALAQAYASMKAANMVFEPAEGSESTPRESPARQTTAVTTRQAFTTQAAPTRQEPAQRRTSSGVFGASNGTSADDMRDKPAVPQIQVPSNATPEEIIAHWKSEQIRQGFDPNAAFHQAFSKRK